MRLTAPFGSFSRSLEMTSDGVRVTRTLTLKSTTVAAADYAAVREFAQHVHAADDAAIVLTRK